jgi:elongation factor Ts
MIDYKKLKQLREDTGVSFSLCKKALEETKNNIERSKKLLSKWGVEKANDKQSRETKQGAIFSYVHHNKKIAVLVEIVCETDFVGKNKDFQTLGTEIAMQIASVRVNNVDELLSIEYMRDSSKKISDLIKDAILKFGENIKISRFVKWELGL